MNSQLIMYGHDAPSTPVVVTNGLEIKFYPKLTAKTALQPSWKLGYLLHCGQHATIAEMGFWGGCVCCWLVVVALVGMLVVVVMMLMVVVF